MLQSIAATILLLICNAAYAQVGAHRDKTEFLRAVEQLGASADRDIALLSLIANENIEVIERKGDPRVIGKSFKAYRLFRDQEKIPLNLNYIYRLREDGAYVADIRFDLRNGVECIRVQDLQHVIGKAERVATYPPSPHAKKTGPNPVWSMTYRLESDARAHFLFDTQECAGSLAIRRNLN